ncbi:MAG: hypothetical protein JW855_01610, partial [Gammaproteobacteria bacterium]|nr:hypothetical protein [Gammaproteobacteria bacterium]
MKKNIIALLLFISFSGALLAGNVVQTQQNTPTQNPSKNYTLDSNSNNVITSESDFLNLSSQSLGIKGPLNLGLQYSRNYGIFLSGKYVQRLNLFNALALGAELGAKQRRVDLSWANLLTNRQRIKFTAEYLAQKLDFNFLSGKSTNWVGQQAYGASYEYLLHNPIARYFSLNAYYADAQNKNLSIKTYQDDTGYYENLRRIAGAKTYGGSLGITITPAHSNMLGASLDYDKVDYDMRYESSKGQNRSGLGATLNFAQLFSPYVKVSLLASDRKTYDTYQADLDWLLIHGLDHDLTFSLNGSRIIGGGSLPNDTVFGINMMYHWDTDGASQSHFLLDPFAQQSDLKNWVNDPAVYMQEVLAVKDEAKIQLKNTTEQHQNAVAAEEKPFPTDFHPKDETYDKNVKIPDIQYKALDLFNDPAELFNTLTLWVTGLDGSGLQATFTPDPEEKDNGTLVISGTTSNVDESYQVKIHAKNLYGESEQTQDFTITIGEAQKPTVQVHQQPPYKIGQAVENQDIADIDAVTGTLD